MGCDPHYWIKLQWFFIHTHWHQHIRLLSQTSMETSKFSSDCIRKAQFCLSYRERWTYYTYTLSSKKKLVMDKDSGLPIYSTNRPNLRYPDGAHGANDRWGSHAYGYSAFQLARLGSMWVAHVSPIYQPSCDPSRIYLGSRYFDWYLVMYPTSNGNLILLREILK